jgi:4-diphosphocytidyl-2-C-methyl-D-erythritol kinase
VGSSALRGWLDRRVPTDSVTSLRTTTRSVRVRASAKINIHLSVGPLRPDGYHELRTVFQAVDLCDELVATTDSALSLTVAQHREGGAGPLAEVPSDGRNLAWRAAELLAARAGIEPNIALALTKHIPVAAGLAGGSADAAATLIACDALWDTRLSPAELAGLAAEIGSDVAFCIEGGTALGTGRGEHLSSITTPGHYYWVLAIADGELSTPAVYAELDRIRATRAGDPIEVSAADAIAALRTGDPVKLAPHLHNDLQPAAIALAPYLAGTLAAGSQLGALAAIVSGSGPTCAFLAPDEIGATALASALAAEGVCRTTRIATGPAAGVRIVNS